MSTACIIRDCVYTSLLLVAPGTIETYPLPKALRRVQETKLNNMIQLESAEGLLTLSHIERIACMAVLTSSLAVLSP